MVMTVERGPDGVVTLAKITRNSVWLATNTARKTVVRTKVVPSKMSTATLAVQSGCTVIVPLIVSGTTWPLMLAV